MMPTKPLATPSISEDESEEDKKRQEYEQMTMAGCDHVLDAPDETNLNVQGTSKQGKKKKPEWERTTKARRVAILDVPQEAKSNVQLPPLIAHFPTRLPFVVTPIVSDVQLEPYLAPNDDRQVIPTEYIKDVIALHGRRLLASALSVTPVELKLTSPNGATAFLKLQSDMIEPPSHVFTIYETQPTKNRPLFVPGHAIALAAFCAKFPLLPRSSSSVKGPFHAGDIVQAPIVSLVLPSPSSFSHLLSYFYTQSPPLLLGALLPNLSSLEPFNPNDKRSARVASGSIALLGTLSPSPSVISRQLAKSCNIATLISHIQLVFGVWKNAAALGVEHELRTSDEPNLCDDLWSTIDLAWEVLIGAIKLQQEDSQE